MAYTTVAKNAKWYDDQAQKAFNKAKDLGKKEYKDFLEHRSKFARHMSVPICWFVAGKVMDA